MFYVEYDSFEISSSGLITGRISIKVDEEYYPEKDWNDFVITILNWWAVELDQFISGASMEANFSFMDGPFLVKFCNGGATSRIMFINSGKEVEQVVRDTKRLKFDAFKSILEVIKSSLETCDCKKWSNDETKKLISNYTNLRKYSSYL